MALHPTNKFLTVIQVRQEITDIWRKTVSVANIIKCRTSIIEKARSTGRNSELQEPFCQPHSPHYLAFFRNQTSRVRGQRLFGRAMARPKIRHRRDKKFLSMD
jgi:hypothetical protein